MIKYKYLNNEKSLLICFDKKSQKDIVSLMECISTSIQQSKQAKYFISIDGVDGTIDTFIESCVSNNYRIYDNGRYRRFIKYMPTLCLLSNSWSDIITFYDFLGSFNEGQMCLSFIDSEISIILENEAQKDRLFDKIEKHCFVEIAVPPDGDVFEITCGSLGYDFMNIFNWLSKQNAVVFDC